MGYFINTYFNRVIKRISLFLYPIKAFTKENKFLY